MNIHFYLADSQGLCQGVIMKESKGKINNMQIKTIYYKKMLYLFDYFFILIWLMG